MNEPLSGQSDWSAKTVFSTGEAATVCNVSQQTIIRCFDNGRLQGFRVPGSKFRRIPREELIRFMHDNDIPLSRIEGQRRAVLCIATAGSELSRLAEAVSPRDRLDIVVAATGFDAGWAARERRPCLVVVDAAADAAVGDSVIQGLSADGGRPPMIAVVGSNGCADCRVDLAIDAGASAFEIEQKIVSLLDEAETSGHG